MSERKLEINTCSGTGCGANGAFDVHKTLIAEIANLGLQNKVSIVSGSCRGLCGQGPVMEINPGNICYGKLNQGKVAHIVEQHLLKGKIVPEFRVEAPAEEELFPLLAELPFYKKQKFLVLRNKGIIDPDDIRDSIARDGYTALGNVLSTMEPDDVVDEVIQSGLRGRGGGGFPTGLKWKICKEEKNTPRYIIGNCDEGDPGAYMDRSLIESDPHSVIEGMTIAAYAIGALKGYMYIRTEYPLAIERMKTAIAQAEEYGLLGENILESGFHFHIEVREGSGAFVCGEETSLIHSIEGNNPEPTQRPPYPAQVGIWGKPTVINNVETLANIPLILNRSAEWFSQIGTESSKGTKIFSLVGKIKNAGLIEVPMGITLKEIIYEIGDGIPGRKDFKAVQTGGPSGGCIPREHIDLPIDYESLKEYGSMMGSGGMIVMDDDTCMVDVAKYFIQFTNDESCGKCTTCRDGSDALLEVLNRITTGGGREGDIEYLEELSHAIKDASMCGLGTSLPNPVLSTLKYFKNEYEAHIHEKRCPSLVCRDLIVYRIIEDKCTGCQRCVGACPTDAITGPRLKPHNLDASKCIKCRACYEICKFDAIAGDAIVIRTGMDVYAN